MPPPVDSGAATVLIGSTVSPPPNLLYAKYPNARAATVTTPAIAPPTDFENGIILKQI